MAVINYLNARAFDAFKREPYLLPVLRIEDQRLEDQRLNGPIEPDEVRELVNKIRNFVVWRCQERGVYALRLRPGLHGLRTLPFSRNHEMDLHRSLLELFTHLNRHGEIVPEALPNPLPEIDEHCQIGELGCLNRDESVRIEDDNMRNIIFMIDNPHLISQVCKSWNRYQNSLLLAHFQRKYRTKNLTYIPRELQESVDTNAKAKAFFKILNNRNKQIADDSVREYNEFNRIHIESQIEKLTLKKDLYFIGSRLLALIVVVGIFCLFLIALPKLILWVGVGALFLAFIAAIVLQSQKWKIDTEISHLQALLS